MSNLKPKKGDGKSISQISEMLRNPIVERDERSTEVVEKKEKREKEVDRVVNSKLENMVLEAKNNTGGKKRPVMIEEDLFEIFAFLKAKKRVSASSLVTLILRNWVQENKEELDKIIKVQ